MKSGTADPYDPSGKVVILTGASSGASHPVTVPAAAGMTTLPKNSALP